MSSCRSADRALHNNTTNDNGIFFCLLSPVLSVHLSATILFYTSARVNRIAFRVKWTGRDGAGDDVTHVYLIRIRKVENGINTTVVYAVKRFRHFFFFFQTNAKVVSKLLLFWKFIGETKQIRQESPSVWFIATYLPTKPFHRVVIIITFVILLNCSGRRAALALDVFVFFFSIIMKKKIIKSFPKEEKKKSPVIVCTKRLQYK